MIFQSEVYANGKHTMPDRDDKGVDKDSEEYNKRIAEYVYSQFCKGGTYVEYDWYSSVTRNRKYALGQQDREKYMDAFYGKEQNNSLLENFNEKNTRLSRRKAYANLNFDIQSPVPRVMDGIVNKISRLVNRVSVDATDRYSGARREELKWGTYVDGVFRKEMSSLRAIMALPQQDLGYTPRSVEELSLYEAEGGFKLGYEEVMERLLKFSFEYSYWDEHSLKEHITDLITNGFTASEDYYDKNTGHVGQRYIDAEYVGVQYTRDTGYRKPDFGFYVRHVKLSELYKKGIEEKKLLSAAKTFEEYGSNPRYADWNKDNKTSLDYKHYDQYTVPVFVVKWIDIDYKNEKEYKNRQGKTRTKEVEKDYKPNNREKLIETRMKTSREVNWLIGTDVVYDYGKCEFQGRDGLSEPVLPIHMVKVTGRPIIPRLIPSLDQYMMAWMRLQQGINMAAMNGFAINMDAISNLNMGGKKMSPRDVLKFWRQTGTLFFKPTDVAGRVNPGMMTRPIEQLPGGAGAVIQEAVQVMDLAMREIERLTGVNPVSLGEAPNPGVGKAVTEYSLAGTNEVLNGILEQVNYLKADVARAMTLRLQHVIEADNKARDAYVDIIGETSIELVKIANGGDIKYGVRTHARPTEQDVAELKEMISLSLKNGRDGKVGITEADAVRFNSMINSGASLKRVALLLDFANKKAQEEAEARAMRAQQLDTQKSLMIDQQKSQSERQKRFEEMQAKIAEENAKGRAQILEQAVSDGKLNWNEAIDILNERPQTPPPQVPQQQDIANAGERVMPMQEEAV